MKSATITRLLDKDEIPDGFPVQLIEGTITKLYKVTKGDGQFGPYEFQNGELKDAEGNTMKICFSSNTQHSSAQGKKVRMGCVKTEHGLKGVMVEDTKEREKDGKKYPSERILKITAVAEVIYEGGQAVGNTAPQSAGSQTQGQTYLQQKPSEIIRDVLAMHDSVFSIVNDHYKDQTAEFRQSFIASVFIEANKQGACQHFIQREGVPKEENKKEVDQNNLYPADWPYAIVPSGSQKGKTLKEVPDDMAIALFEYYDSRQSNTPFAECVFQMARDRGLIPKKEDEDNLP